jgi:glycosyltransferase involved in cell wall biosynthesis
MSMSIGSEAGVAIVIAYYNQPLFIREAVQSARQQTHPNVEIIVVDDGSAVPVESILPKYDNLSVIRTKNNGVSAARNLGFSRSSAEFVIFLDQDDRLLPNAIEAHLHALGDHPTAGLSFGSVRDIDADGRLLREAHCCRPRKNYLIPLLESNPVGPSPGAAMVTRSSFVAAGGFDETLSSMGEDYLLYLQIARIRPLARHTTCVLEYRVHTTNASHNQARMLRGTMAALDRIEAVLGETERRRLPHARRRWKHAMLRRPTLAYRIWGLYFSFRAMLNVPLRSYFLK